MRSPWALFFFRKQIMLFQKLAALTAKGVNVNIQISQAAEGKLEVAFIPTSESGKSGIALVAKAFTATPEELDAEMGMVIDGYVKANTSLAEQLVELELQAEQAAATAREEAEAKATQKAATKATSSTSVTRKPGKAPLDADAELMEFGASASSAPQGGGDSDDDASQAGTSGSTVGEPMAFTL